MVIAEVLVVGQKKSSTATHWKPWLRGFENLSDHCNSEISESVSISISNLEDTCNFQRGKLHASENINTRASEWKRRREWKSPREIWRADRQTDRQRDRETLSKTQEPKPILNFLIKQLRRARCTRGWLRWERRARAGSNNSSYYRRILHGSI
jgi:hypothetical protein